MAENRTRIVELGPGARRGRDDNARTELATDVRDVGAATPDFPRLFEVAWPELHRQLARFTTPGVVVVAVDAAQRKVAGAMCLAAKVDQANAAIIGRHDQCDLFLPGDGALSLRHLALVVAPLFAVDDDLAVEFRLVDLRTSEAFVDETGRRLEHVVADGPTFVGVGRFALFFLVSGERTTWPDAAQDAWACLPERVHLDERDAEPDRWRRRRRGARPAPRPTPPSLPAAVAPGLASGTRAADAGARNGGRRVTSVRTQLGPARAKIALLADGDRAMGTMVLSSRRGRQDLVIGEQAASAGILVGRYSRCDTHGAAVVDDGGISRVHLLVVRLGDRLFAVDTGSVNGTFRVAGADDLQVEVRATRLDDGVELVLGRDLARLRWRAAPAG